MDERGNLLSLIQFSLFIGLLIGIQAHVLAQDSNYANTPDDIFPYNNFQSPYYNFFEEPQLYLGAAREYEVPSDINTVKIGLIGPLEDSGKYDSIYGQQMLQGSRLALEEANKNGGYDGIPFELIARNDAGIWGATANELVALAGEQAIGVIGSIDGNNSHVAARVALKLELPLVNTGTTDPTLTEHRIPWLIRSNSDDRQFNYALLNEIYNKRGYTRVAVVRANSRYARLGTREFIDGARRLGYPVSRQILYSPGQTRFEAVLETISDSDAEAVLFWGEVNEAAHFVKQMRELNMDHTVFGSDRLVSNHFLQLAGKSAEGVVAVYPYNPNSNRPELKRFYSNFTERFGHEPDAFAVQAYDGMSILIDAINKAGLNRALVRDELTSISQYDGISGKINFDATFNNISPVWMAEVENGVFKFWEHQWRSQAVNE